MKVEMILPAGVWPELKDHLLAQGQAEQLAFLLAGVARGADWLRLLVRECVPVPPEAFVKQTAAYLAVEPTFSREILARCADEGLSLVEVHSHPFCRENVAFSRTDLDNEEKKFHYVATKIPHIYHATMVVGQRDLDAHLWVGREGRAVPLDRVRLLERPITDMIPTSAPVRAGAAIDPAPWLDRQVRAFGPEAQHRLQMVGVGVVGCGGTGSVMVEMLAHLGVQRLVLIDPDRVETTNLNRLVGATPNDARRARPKVDVARRLVRRVNPKAQVQALALSVDAPEAVAALKGLDLILGCTDNHGSRLILNQLAVQYLLPYLDLGAGLEATAREGLAAAGGQVRLVRPGDFCLACIDGLDRSRAGQDLLPEFGRQRQVARGYVQGADLPTPAVLFLNAAIGALAMAEFVNLWTGYREPVPLAYLDLLDSRLTTAGAQRRSDCVACGRGAGLACGDLEPLPGVGRERMKNSVPALRRGEEGDDGKTHSQ